MFDRYLNEFGTIAKMCYTTNITINHHGRVVFVENRQITILKSDGSHVTSNIENFRLDNPSKFLRV